MEEKHSAEKTKTKSALKKAAELPYERFLRFGPENLTEIELLAIILRTGTKDNHVLQVAEEVKRHFPGQVYATVIPRTVRLSEAPSHGKPIDAYDSYSRGTEAYAALADELIAKNA